MSPACGSPPEVGYAFGPRALFLTTDGGRHWARQRDGSAYSLEIVAGMAVRVLGQRPSCAPGCEFRVQRAAAGTGSAPAPQAGAGRGGLVRLPEPVGGPGAGGRRARYGGLGHRLDDHRRGPHLDRRHVRLSSRPPVLRASTLRARVLVKAWLTPATAALPNGSSPTKGSSRTSEQTFHHP